MNEIIGVQFSPTYLSCFCSLNYGGAFAFIAFSWDSLYQLVQEGMFLLNDHLMMFFLSSFKSFTSSKRVSLL